VQLDLSNTHTLAEAQAKLAHWSSDHPNPRWIVGRGWDEARWALGRSPVAADLDAAVADRPVWLERADGHVGLANSAALAIAKAPSGDRGLFTGEAMAAVTRVIPPPLPRERDAAVAKAQEIMLASGITAVADLGTTAEDWNSFRRFGDAGGLSVRIISYAAGIDPLLAIAGGGPTPWLYNGRLRMLGVQLQADGRKRGEQYDEDARLRNLMSRAAMDGFQVVIRAIGADANRQSLDAIDELALTYKNDRRWRIEHGHALDPADLPRLGKNGIIASIQSDYPVGSPNLLPRIVDATSLTAFTSEAARATFAEERIGTLAPGMSADFLLLDRDIIAAAPTEVGPAKVMETWIGGVRAWIRK
jgi:predicted amidohydrolase YtcJ